MTVAYLNNGCPIPIPAGGLTDAVDSIGVSVTPNKEDAPQLAGEGTSIEVLYYEDQYRCLFVESRRVGTTYQDVAWLF